MKFPLCAAFGMQVDTRNPAMQNRMISLNATLRRTDANCVHVTFLDMSVAQAVGSAYQRRRAERIEARLAALETKLGVV